MWSVGSKRGCDVYVGTRAFAACDGVAPIVVEGVEGFEAALREMAEWLKDESTSTPRHLRIWLSGGLCRPFITPVLQGVNTSIERLTVTKSMAPQQTGLTGPCVVFVDQRERSSPAVAVQEDHIQQIYGVIEASTRRSQLKIPSIRPWWAEVLRYALVRDPTLGALGVQDCDSLTLLVGPERGKFMAATTYAPVTDRETAKLVLARALMSAEIDDGAALFARLALREATELQRDNDLVFGPFAELSR